MPSPNQIMKYFEFAHLPDKLQGVSRPIGELAKQMDEIVPDSAEKSAGLRKLLEAKDCLVRAALPLLLIFAALCGVVSADEYHDLGCYVGSMTREEFYANKYVVVPQSTESDLAAYRKSEAERIRRHEQWLESMRPKTACKFKVGDVVESRDYAGRKFTVRKVFDAGGQWRLRSEVIGSPIKILSVECESLDLYESECLPAKAASKRVFILTEKDI